MEFKTRYNTDKVTLNCPEETRTKQNCKDECDINFVLKKYKKTGILPKMIKQDPIYGDFSEVQTYHESMNCILHAQEQFNALSSHVRARFDNSPAKFLEFCNDDKNKPEMAEMGLLKPEVAEAVKNAKKSVEKTPEQPKKEKKVEEPKK